MCDPSSPSGYRPSDIAPEFIKQIEAELSRRLGQRVSLVLGDGIVAVRANRGFPAGVSAVVMSVGPLLCRRQAVEWADALEHKISRVCARVQDVEHLFAEIQKSPTPEKTGAIVLAHLEDYDDEFFEALAEVIIREKGRLRLNRVHNFEALREYLWLVCRRAKAGETADMWRELAQGAARDRDLAS
ncbi:MAG TPA: hypothetical protein VEH31_45185 [Streptosporangiaceae bacterium]|nr:hypothetical protein [Streptosporangiaceae bacterium]